MPTFSVAGYVGMLAATFASIVESMGDYFATARICEVAPPPTHALNRGIAMEGFGSIISGLVGAGHATTSYSGNIGAIGITRVRDPPCVTCSVDDSHQLMLCKTVNGSNSRSAVIHSATSAALEKIKDFDHNNTEKYIGALIRSYTITCSIYVTKFISSVL